jgi:peptidoglycan hydrolase CwlO-like protein
MKSKVTLSAIILSAFAFFAVFSLSACTDEAAEAEMNRLAAENAVLQGQVDSLQKNLDSLTAYGDSVKKSLEKLDMHP